MIGAAKVKHVHLACVYIEKQWKSSAVEREKIHSVWTGPYGITWLS